MARFYSDEREYNWLMKTIEGDLYGVNMIVSIDGYFVRQPSESDENFRERIKAEMLEKAVGEFIMEE